MQKEKVLWNLRSDLMIPKIINIIIGVLITEVCSKLLC